MDPLTNPTTALAFTAWLLLLLLNARETQRLSILSNSDDIEEELLWPSPFSDERPLYDTTTLIATALQNFQLCTTVNVFHDEMRFWVKPRLTMWFSRFLVEQYDINRWVSMFRMTKPVVLALTEFLKPHIQKKNTKYRLAVLVLVRVSCTLFKLTHGTNFTICSKMFAVGRSTVSKMLREVVHAINECLWHEISWPTGQRLRETQEKFSRLCSLPVVVGAIDGMQISISKPPFCAVDYFYFKSGGYSMNCQAVVDSEKRFLDLYVGMPSSTNDSRMLCRSSLFHLASRGDLFDATHSVHGFSPYLLGDLGYPLLPWLIVPHRDEQPLSISETHLNKKLRRGRTDVENAFGILKQSFRKLLVKSELQLTFLPDIVVCCGILHNILLRQLHEEVEDFLQVLHREGFRTTHDEALLPGKVPIANQDDITPMQAVDKRTHVGQYLTTRCGRFIPTLRIKCSQPGS